MTAPRTFETCPTAAAHVAGLRVPATSGSASHFAGLEVDLPPGTA